MEQTLDTLHYQDQERRTKSRIHCAYPAIIKGWDTGHRKFRAGATLTDLSANGLCLLLKEDIQLGNKVFVLFRCSSTGPLGTGKAPLIAVQGKIVRASQPDENINQVGIRILQSRFL
jgi:PilZ domain